MCMYKYAYIYRDMYIRMVIYIHTLNNFKYHGLSYVYLLLPVTMLGIRGHDVFGFW